MNPTTRKLSRETIMMIVKLLVALDMLLLLFVSIRFFVTNISPPSHISQPPSPAAFDVVHLSKTPSPTSPPSHQLNKIIDALIGAGDFAGWANILTSTDPQTLPITATLFIPTNDAIAMAANSTGTFLPDTFLIPYHIVPQRLTFDDLRKYPVLSKLPTLLPTKFIVVTNDSVENFMVDGTRITHPDLYLTGSFSVHGVMDVLDYNVFGDGVLMKNGTLVKNETANEGKNKEPENGVGEVSCAEFRSRVGGFLGWKFWTFVGVVVIAIQYFDGGDFTDPDFWCVLGTIILLAFITNSRK